jgi:hypothetical protein
LKMKRCSCRPRLRKFSSNWQASQLCKRYCEIFSSQMIG